MGDFGGALLSTVEAPPSVPLKAGALHVEDAQSSRILALHDPINQFLHKMSSEASTSLKPVDSPMQNATPAEPATPTSRSGSSEAPPQTMTKDFAAAAPAEASRPPTVRSSKASSFKPPTPIRSYREHPRLWIEDGPKAGKAMADWKHNYAPILFDQTREFTTEQRTKFFDRLEQSDSERYQQAIATFYWLHPELLPEREPDPRTLRKQEEGMKPNTPKMDREQQECFNGWDNWGPRTTAQPLEVGPHGEATPDVEKEELKASCVHCEQEKIKQNKLTYKFKTALSFKKKDGDKTQRAVAITVRETDPEEEQRRSESALAIEEDKENQACTEMIANKAIAPAPYKPKGRSIIARMRSSTALAKA